MPKLTEEQRRQRALKRAKKRALEAERQDQRREERRERWVREGMYLSWEELQSGVACRGCGDPIIDGLGSWPALMKMTAKERAEHDAEDARFRERHKNCHEGRWSVGDSRAQHCFFCCPPPPLSPAKQAEIVRLLSSFARPEEKELDVWRLLLTCDHVAERTQHHTNQSWTSSVVECPECGVNRGVVESAILGRAHQVQAGKVRSERQAERERLEAELRAEEKKVERHQKTLSNAEERAEKLRSQLESLE